ncbi:MAG: UDP-N-acetylmuramate dehydrogenase [Bacteroidales bacterium]
MNRLLTNVSLKPFNTFGVDVSASHVFNLKQPADLHDLQGFRVFREMSGTPGRILVLGQGSNILFTGDFEGIVIRNEIGSIKLIGEDSLSVTVEVGAGVIWNDLVDYAVSSNWWGIENLALIPGTAGASPVQNIGAYGVEAADVIIRVNAFNLDTGQWMVLENSDCRFGYRDSIFKRSLRNKVVICSVVFRLSKRAEPRLEYSGVREELARRGIIDPSAGDIAEAVAAIRRSKLPDPALLGNGGSFFKNPVVSEALFQRLKGSYPLMPFHRQEELYKIPAGWLIEQAGWKGYRSGNVGCYEKQSLILVNYGNATGREILDLSERISGSVASMFGIDLEREVNVI